MISEIHIGPNRVTRIGIRLDTNQARKQGVATMVTGSGNTRRHACRPRSKEDRTPSESCGDCVRISALGCELSERQLKTLRNLVEIRMLSKGDVLILEGEQDDKLYAVAAGELEVCRAAMAGRDIILQRVVPGSITGELAFLDGLPRTATVRAASDACVIALRRHQLEGLVASDPQLAHMIMRAIVRSAHHTVGSLDTDYTDMVRYVSG